MKANTLEVGLESILHMQSCLRSKWVACPTDDIVNRGDLTLVDVIGAQRTRIAAGE